VNLYQISDFKKVVTTIKCTVVLTCASPDSVTVLELKMSGKEGSGKGGCSLKRMFLVGPTEAFGGLTYSLHWLWLEVSFEVESSKRHSG